MDKKNMYESMFIIYTGDDDETSRNKVIDEIQTELKKQKGKVVSVYPMGKRTFTYHIKGKKDGYYYLINFEVNPLAIQKLVERFKINTSILRELIIKVDKFSDFKELPISGQSDHVVEKAESAAYEKEIPAGEEETIVDEEIAADEQE